MGFELIEKLKLGKKKGITLAQFGSIALSFVVVAIILSMGGEILSQVQSGQTANSTAYSITGKGLTGMETFGNWLPTIAIVVAASVIIGIILMYFAYRDRE